MGLLVAPEVQLDRLVDHDGACLLVEHPNLWMVRLLGARRDQGQMIGYEFPSLVAVLAQNCGAECSERLVQRLDLRHLLDLVLSGGCSPNLDHADSPFNILDLGQNSVEHLLDFQDWVLGHLLAAKELECVLVDDLDLSLICGDDDGVVLNDQSFHGAIVFEYHWRRYFEQTLGLHELMMFLADDARGDLRANVFFIITNVPEIGWWLAALATAELWRLHQLLLVIFDVLIVIFSTFLLSFPERSQLRLDPCLHILKHLLVVRYRLPILYVSLRDCRLLIGLLLYFQLFHLLRQRLSLHFFFNSFFDFEI